MTHPELRQSLDYTTELAIKAMQDAASKAQALYGTAETQAERDNLDSIKREAMQAVVKLNENWTYWKSLQERSHGTMS